MEKSMNKRFLVIGFALILGLLLAGRLWQQASRAAGAAQACCDKDAGPVSEPVPVVNAQTGGKSSQRTHVAGASRLAVAASFTNATPIGITDCPNPCPASGQAATLYPSPITVSGEVGVVQRVSITLNGYSHGFPADVDFLLVSPSGRKSVVMSDFGAGSPGVSNINVTLDDYAQRPVPSTVTGNTGYSFVTGTYRPANSGTSDAFPASAPAGPYTYTMSAFNGDNPNGVWNLYVIDDANLDGGNISGGWTISFDTRPAAPPAGSVIVSEFRTRGAGTTPPGSDGSADEFIELYNTTNSSITIIDAIPGADPTSAPNGTGAGWRLAGAQGGSETTFLIIPQTQSVNGPLAIPAHGHFLFTTQPTVPSPAGNTYSLSTYPTGTGITASGTTNIAINPASATVGFLPDDVGISIFSTTGALSANRLDSVGYSSVTNADFKEGTGLSPANGITTAGQHSWVRKTTTSGAVQDTGNNANDFVLVDTTGATLDGVAAVLGAPGPQRGPTLTAFTTTSAPIHDPTANNMPSAVIDPMQPIGSAPNTVYDTTPVTNGALGTIKLRVKFTNNSGLNLLSLRYRVVDLSTLTGGAVPPGQADLRVLSSTQQTVTLTDTSTVTVQALTLQTPPAQASGGGLNSSLGELIITTTAPLGNGASTNVEFALGVQQYGTIRFAIIAEALNTQLIGVSGVLPVTGTVGPNPGEITLFQNVPPVISMDPQSQTVCAGQPATFSVMATGTAPLTYQWQKDTVDIPGATNSSYTIPSTVVADSGSYRVVVGSPSGSTTSNPAALVVNPIPPTPTITANGPTCSNQSVTLTSSSATGNQWFLDGNPIGGATGQNYTATTSGSYTVVVTASGCSSASSAPISVIIGAITINPASLPNATINTAYTQTLSTTPASGSFTFAVTNGVLPTGLTLNSNGSFSGAPTQSGVFNFRVTAGIIGSCTGFRDYVLIVDCQTITVNPASLPGGTVGTAYSQSVSATPAGTYNYSVTSGALPPGLTLNSSTGEITGTPTTIGSFSFTVTASQGGCSGSLTYQVTIACPAITVLPAPPLPNGQAGIAYSQTISASPAGSYTFSLATGNLPAGLTLNSATGVISGIPSTTGSTTFTIKAQAASGCFSTQSYTLVIDCPPITVNPATLPSGTTGTAYAQTLTASPAGGSYTYAVSSGTLPAGLNLNPSTGLLSGTPSANGSFTFTITATGWGGCTGSTSYTVTVGGGGGCPTITLPASLPNGSVGQLYNASAAASPSGSYTYSVVGTLPPGVTLYSSTGLIFGYPTTVGNYTFTITATQGACTGSQTYTVLIGAGFASSLTVFSDFDGDGKSDLSVFRGNEGNWLVANSGNGQSQSTAWGSSAAPYNDITVSGDYDGDGKTDLAVFRRGGEYAGYWFIKRSSDGQVSSYFWGLGTDIPVPGDYDSDGKTDVAVWRGSLGAWYIVRSSDGEIEATTWGYALLGDIPVPGDYDGDSKTDVAVFRRSSGDWYIRRSSDGMTTSAKWGVGTDVPVPGDFDGDNRTDIAVWRMTEGAWYIIESSSATLQTVILGANGDVPVSGDYDGDGKADATVWRGASGTWLIKRSSDGSEVSTVLGQTGDVPVAAKKN